jgi:hypothetical protein
MRTLLVCAALLAVGGLAASNASAITVDHFDNSRAFDLIVGTASGGATQTDTLSGPAAFNLGGTRVETLALNQNTGNLSTAGEASHTPSSATLLTFSNGSLARSTLTLTYSFAVTDFKAGGANELEVLFAAADLGGETTVVTATDSAGRTSTDTVTQPSTGSFTQLFLYSAFTGTANFNFLTGLSYQLQSTVDGDYALDSLFTNNGSVPEPVTMFGLVMGLGGLTQYIRRRRRS